MTSRWLFAFFFLVACSSEPTAYLFVGSWTFDAGTVQVSCNNAAPTISDLDGLVVLTSDAPAVVTATRVDHWLGPLSCPLVFDTDEDVAQVRPFSSCMIAVPQSGGPGFSVNSGVSSFTIHLDQTRKTIEIAANGWGSSTRAPGVCTVALDGSATKQ